MNARATSFKWDEVEADHPLDLLDRRIIKCANMTVAKVTLYRGCVVPQHAHSNEQTALILSGRMRFTIAQPDGEQVLVLGPGEALHLPSNVPHGAEALEDSVVLDLFSPAIEKMGIDRDS